MGRLLFPGDLKAFLGSGDFRYAGALGVNIIGHGLTAAVIALEGHFYGVFAHILHTLGVADFVIRAILQGFALAVFHGHRRFLHLAVIGVSSFAQLDIAGFIVRNGLGILLATHGAAIGIDPLAVLRSRGTGQVITGLSIPMSAIRQGQRQYIAAGRSISHTAQLFTSGRLIGGLGITAAVCIILSQRFKIPQHIIIRHAGVHIALGILPNIRIHAGFANLHRGGKISGFWLPVGVPQLIALAMQRLHIQIIGKPIHVGVNHRGVARCANGVAKSSGVLNNGLFVAVVQDLLILQVISHRQHKTLVLALHLSQHALNIIGLNRGLLGIVRIAVMVHAKGHTRCLRRVHIVPKLRIQVVVAVAHTDHGKGLARLLPCGVIHTFSVMLRHIGAKRRRRSGCPYR